MRFGLSRWFLCTSSWMAIGLLVGTSVAPRTIDAQEDGKSTEQAASEDSSEKEKEDAKEDKVDERFIVPEEGTVEELFSFMDEVKKIRPEKRTYKSMVKLAKQVFPAVIEASDVVLAKADNDEDIAKAVKSKFEAYGILVRYDPSQKEAADALAEEWSDDARPEIAAIAVGQILSGKTAKLRKASAEEVEALTEELSAFIERFGPNKTTFGTASGMARVLGYTEHTELAASLYESLGTQFAEAEDERVRDRASSFAGAARRLRLPGNTMEVFGQTAAGDEFDWSTYKGKVVLVDFWASWCGPCLGELPNMKKNLEMYGDKGFAIVGINMDSTRDAMDKCVEKNDISWVNIFNEEEGKMGWSAPMATHYGISGIPTAILVNKEGKVVSLRARGSELDKQLVELLGPVEEAAPEPVEEEGTPEEKSGS